MIARPRSRVVRAWSGLVLAVVAASSCASGPAVSTEPVSGFVEAATGGLGAMWSREAGVLVVVVRPTPGAVVSRVPKAGVVVVNGAQAYFERGAKPGQVVARVPYTGTARDLDIAMYVRDATDKTVLSFTNRTSPEAKAEFEAWVLRLEQDVKRMRGMR